MQSRTRHSSSLPRTFTGMMEIDIFTGGLFDTNCFFLLEHGILIDAPQDTATWLQQRGHRVKTLLITHGHIDHVWDAATIQRQHTCQVAYHPDGHAMLTEPDFFKRYGFNWEITPIQPGFTLDETHTAPIEGVPFHIFHIPGHCPGSLCFYHEKEQLLFGGDVLFAGSIGRTDLPGGDHALLLRGIREKLWPLPDATRVLPGHGPATTIGIERATNPYLR